MISIALDQGAGARLMFCGYKYAPDDPRTGERATDLGPIQWIPMRLERGVWVGDLTAYHPVAFETVEAARAARDDIARTHAPLAERLRLVNATTGTEIESADDGPTWDTVTDTPVQRGPSFSPRFDAYLAEHVLPTIESAGFAVQGVFATTEGHSSFCYTVGLTVRGWPELIVLGPTDVGHPLLNRIVEYLDGIGEVPTAGDLPDFMETGYRLRLRACTTRGDFPFSIAHALYPDVVGLQVLMPDDQHRYPGEDGACSLTWQKVLAAP